MKRKNNVIKTHRKRRNQDSDDLVTMSEATVSSQASVYTNQSRPAHRLNSLYSQSGSQNLEQFEDFEDIISEEIDTLFITPEEEKKIQNILQFARKGKINPKNAFEIPVRVIDPQVTQNVNMRFWKIASELLGASMNVYDKRVENTFLDTHRMFDTLVRVQDKRNQPLTEEQIEEKSRKQRGQILQMQIGDLGKAENVSSYEIGSFNCEQAERINIKNKNNQFIADPMFNKRLQAFDSNTLKSLFLNVFQTNSELQVQFFSQKEQNPEKMEAQTKVQYKMEAKEEQNQSGFDLSDTIEEIISQELRRSISSTSGEGEVFKYMDIMRKQNITEINRFSIKDFTTEIQVLSKKQFEYPKDYSLDLQNQSLNDQTTSVASFNMDFHHENTSNHLHQDQNQTGNTNPMTQTNTKTVSYSTDLYYNEFKNEDEDYEGNHTMMTPWELQFKGLKLMKKRNPRGIKTQSKPKRQIKRVQHVQLNFLDGVILQRKAILKEDKVKQPRDIPYKDKFLTMNMNPYHEMHKKHFKIINSQTPHTNFLQHTQQQQSKYLSHQSKNPYEAEPFHDEPDQRESANKEQPMQMEEQTNSNFEKVSDYSAFFGFQQHESRGQMFRSTSIKNIRQIKERIYENLGHRDRLKLSQFNFKLTPASILVLFLHLANEKDLIIESINEESDILISKGNS